jgi:hypothetical protein
MQVLALFGIFVRHGMLSPRKALWNYYLETAMNFPYYET